MKILIYRYGSICEPDVITGFRELGNEVAEITAEIYNKNLLPSEGVTLLKNELLAHNYDFVFSINFFPFISEVCNIFKLRYICWTVDSPVMELYSARLQIRGIAYFCLTGRNMRNFLPEIQVVFFTFRWQAIRLAGILSFRTPPERNHAFFP